MQRLDRALGAELVKEAESDTEAADQEDDHRVRAFADERRRKGGAEQQEQERVTQLSRQDRERLRTMAAQAFGPTTESLRRASSAERPSLRD